MAGECLGWSKERSLSGEMKEQDVDLRDRGCTHQAVFLSGPHLGSGLTPAGRSSMALIIVCVIAHSVSSLCLTAVCFHFPFPASYFTFLPLLTIPKAKLTNVRNKIHFFP